MRTFVVAAALLFAIAPAYAQGPNFGDGKKKEDAVLNAKRQAEQDAAYKSSLQRIPAKDAGVDPWGTTRVAPSEGSPSSQGKPKKP